MCAMQKSGVLSRRKGRAYIRDLTALQNSVWEGSECIVRQGELHCCKALYEIEDINQIQEEILPENGLQWRKKIP